MPDAPKPVPRRVLDSEARLLRRLPPLTGGGEMPLYLFFTVVPLALILGFLGGLWLSKRSLVWCDRCGETLTCARCLSRASVSSPARSR